jgi:hypothetical protein
MWTNIFCKLGIHLNTTREIHVEEEMSSDEVFSTGINTAILERCKDCGSVKIVAGIKNTILVISTKYLKV